MWSSFLLPRGGLIVENQIGGVILQNQTTWLETAFEFQPHTAWRALLPA
ncbi:MAG: hypothetical protein SNJ75_03735 [Gemmataceae bacterium]